jgi:DNA (cytosine-5)-methyltransferase 1
MKFISLFAGIGGFDLGLERAGMECVGQVEYNPFCQRVLKKHWPHVKLVGDIHDVTESDFGSVDLVCGGFPCQPFSQAGKRKGSDDNRYLWPEMLRVIEAYRPAWIIGENVVGIVNMALDTVCADLGKIGYNTQCFIIPACAVNAPHRRDRVWIIANANSLRLQEPRAEFETSWDRQLVQRRESWGESWREAASRLCRVGNGVPGRVDRLRSIGNAVVPQVVEVIGRAIRRAHVVCAECAPENTSEAQLTAYNNRKPKLAKSAVGYKI